MTSSAQSQQFPVSLVYKWLTRGLIFNCSSKDGYAKRGRGEGETLGCATLSCVVPAPKDEHDGANPPCVPVSSPTGTLFGSLSTSKKASKHQPQVSG